MDTQAFLLQMGSFWQNLDWPVVAESYGFTTTVMKVCVCSCAGVCVCVCVQVCVRGGCVQM